MQEASQNNNGRIAIGDIIESGGHKFKVLQFQGLQFTPPKVCVWAAPQLKDGSFGKYPGYVGTDWKRVARAEHSVRGDAVTPQL